MPDKRSRRKEIERRRWLTNPRRLCLYADEDISAWAISWLRSVDVNVVTTHDARNAGRDDGFQATFAARRGRVLITHNGKYFLDDRRVPLAVTRGVIALDVDRRNRDSYLTALTIVSEIFVPWAQSYEDMKIRVGVDVATFRFVERGAMRRITLSLDELLEGRYPTDGQEVGTASP